MRSACFLERTLIAIATILAIVLMGQPARAADGSVMIGRWTGFSQSSALPAVQNVLFDITSSKNRRFAGGALLPAVQTPVMIDGNLSADDIVNIQSVGPGGGCIVMHGKTRLLGDGSVRIAALRYHMSDHDGIGTDDGILVLIQNIGGAEWGGLQVPAVQGNYVGGWMSDVFRNPDGGPLGGGAEFMVGRGGQTGSGFNGFGSGFGGDNTVGIEIFGTVGLPAVQRNGMSASPLGGIGVTNNGIIAILIGLLVPAVQTGDGSVFPQSLLGQYFLFGGFSDLFEAVFNGKTMALDHGSFFLPAVQ